jgi:hypothetical protein
MGIAKALGALCMCLDTELIGMAPIAHGLVMRDGTVLSRIE